MNQSSDESPVTFKLPSDVAEQTVPSPAQAVSSPGTPKTVLTIVSLILFFPVGILFMFLWMKWPKWVKVLIVVGYLVVFGIIASLSAVVLIAIDPAKQIKAARDAARVQEVQVMESALAQYFIVNSKYPETLEGLTPDFMTYVPTDPLDIPYEYEVTPDKQSYNLCVTYESEQFDNQKQCARP